MISAICSSGRSGCKRLFYIVAVQRSVGMAYSSRYSQSADCEPDRHGSKNQPNPRCRDRWPGRRSIRAAVAGLPRRMGATGRGWARDASYRPRNPVPAPWGRAWPRAAAAAGVAAGDRAPVLAGRRRAAPAATLVPGQRLEEATRWLRRPLDGAPTHTRP